MCFELMEIFCVFLIGHFPKTCLPKPISEAFIYVLACTYAKKTTHFCCFVTHYLASICVMYYFVQKCRSKFRFVFISEKMQLKKYILHLKCNVTKAVAHFMVPINSQESSAQTSKNSLYFGNRMGHCVWGLKLSITFCSSSVQPTVKNLGIQQQLFEATITKREKGQNLFLLTF